MGRGLTHGQADGPGYYWLQVAQFEVCGAGVVAQEARAAARAARRRSVFMGGTVKDSARG